MGISHLSDIKMDDLRTCLGIPNKVTKIIKNLFVCLFVGFYGISTFVGYLTPNLFLCK